MVFPEADASNGGDSVGTSEGAVCTPSLDSFSGKGAPRAIQVFLGGGDKRLGMWLKLGGQGTTKVSSPTKGTTKVSSFGDYSMERSLAG